MTCLAHGLRKSPVKFSHWSTSSGERTALKMAGRVDTTLQFSRESWPRFLGKALKFPAILGFLRLPLEQSEKAKVPKPNWQM